MKFNSFDIYFDIYLHQLVQCTYLYIDSLKRWNMEVSSFFGQFTLFVCLRFNKIKFIGKCAIVINYQIPNRILHEFVLIKYKK